MTCQVMMLEAIDYRGFFNFPLAHNKRLCGSPSCELQCWTYLSKLHIPEENFDLSLCLGLILQVYNSNVWKKKKAS